MRTMADYGGDPDGDPFGPVRGVLADPSSATGALPELLELLDGDDRTMRVAAALGLCLVAVADPDTVPTVVARLDDRMDEEGHPEARVAYDYLASQFPRRIDEAHQDDDHSGSAGGVPGSSAGTADREGVGRVRPPGIGAYDPRTVEPERSVIDPADPQRNPDADVRDPGSDSSRSRDERPDATDGRFRSDPTERQRWNHLYERLSVIVEHSRFDDLMVLSGRSRDRYADGSRVLAVEGNAERALALRLFHRPARDEAAFTADLETALSEWRAVDDHRHVVSVFDAGTRPRPWAATEPILETLAERADRFEPAVAVSIAADLADALAYVHQHGVIHGGLDPGNVALSSAAVEPPIGALDNVGLLGVYRWYVTPATCLDPRYAAPEYYDRAFGRVDHATDVYHLGAVLYRLVTGRPPFDGPFEEIRERILHEEPPEPSAVADVPDGVDRVVTKAMAKRVLRRYETINDLRGDLRRMHEEVSPDGG